MSEELTIEYRRLDEVARWPRNPKRHDIGAIVESIRRYGFVDPPKYDHTLGALVYGNGRDEALEWMHAQGDAPPRGIQVAPDGMWLMPVKVGIDAPSEAEAEALALDHNNLTLSGGDFTAYDMARLWGDGYTDILSSLALSSSLPITVDGDALDGLLNSLIPPVEPGDGGDDFDTTPADGPTRCQLGDLWAIGPHRLLVGDCTDPANVARLMGGERADMVFTDPPYNVGFMSRKDKSHPLDYTSTPYRDDRTPVEWESFVRSMFCRIDEHLKDGGCFYIWGADKSVVDYYNWRPSNFLFHQNIIWDKEWPFLARRDFLSAHEPCVYGWKQGAERYFHRQPSGENYADIWQVKKINPNDMEHSAQKPVELVVRALRTSSREGDVLLDLFGGSGTTLIGCHREGRAARLCEISPRYADVILRRAEAEGLPCERAE